jgi:hypothetical protein
MSTNKKMHITAIIAFAWCFGIIALYYVSHKPFSPELALNILLSVWRVMVGAALVGLAGGVGWLIYRDNTLNPLAQLALQVAIGLGILALLFLLTGIIIGLPRLLPAILLIGLLALTHKAVWAWSRQLLAFRELWQASDGFSRILAGLIATMLLSAMLLALAPPVKFDALVYHLVLPDAYLRAGRVEYLSWIMKVGMPQTAEMLYTWAMALSGAAGAAVMGWVAGIVTILGLLGYLFQRLGTRPAWVGVAALLAGFSMPVALSWAYVDWWCLMYGFGALVSLDQWRQFGGVRPLVIAGLMAGFALGTKYPAGVLGLAAGVALIWHTWRCRNQLLKNLWPYATAAILAPLPWLIKNLATTGNPVYPLFFESGAMDAIRHNVYQVLPPYGSWQDLVFLPFWATYMGHEGAEGYGAAIGPLLLALGAVAWLGNQQRTLVQKIAFENAAVISLSGLVVWSIGNQFSGFLIQSRFYFAIFPAFVFLAASGFLSLSSIQLSRIRFGRILSALVLLVLLLNTIDVGFFALRQHAPQAVLGIESDETYLAHNLGWYQPAMKALVELPEGDRVLLLLEPRSFYCRPRCEPDETLDRWKRDWLYIKDPTEILQSWRSEGFTHVLFYQLGANFMRETSNPHYSVEEWLALDRFLAGFKQIANFGNAYLLYDIQGQ